MARYAIGDIQGCYAKFMQILEFTRFNPSIDTLYLVGDLVNRGTESLQVLRWVYNHQDSTKTVLGNHDIYLLARYYNILDGDEDETIMDILNAPDSKELILYLRNCPIIHEIDDYLIAHAGIYPKLDLKISLELSQDIREMLNSDNYLAFLKYVYGNKPDHWEDSYTMLQKMKFLINASTRMRYLDSKTFALQYRYKGDLASKPASITPWFKTEFHPSIQKKIIFGHWAALGFYNNSKIVSLDTGCIWGRKLTAFNLDTHQIYQI